MRRVSLNGVLALALSVLGGASAFAATYAMEAQSLQTIKTFVNDNGSALTSGTAVVLRLDSSNMVTGTSKGAASNLGLTVTTTTIANDKDFVGVIADDSCADQSVCRVITYGPALARFACSTSNSTTNLAQLGTTTVAGQLGSGTRAGLLLTGNPVSGGGSGSLDNCLKWVFVAPNLSD